jgi:pimeloyl-ACP methyl ester carboxylesterase
LNIASRVTPDRAGDWAFALFGKSLRTPVLRHERSVQDAARVGVLDVNRNRVVTYHWGDGQCPVLLVHGWNSRGSRFAQFVPALQARGFTPITFDAPGHGESRGRATILEVREVIARLHERHGPFRAVVGHSFGALCAFHAARTGVSTDRLVSISGVCEFGFLVRSFGTQLRLSPRLLERLRRRTEDHFAPEPDIWERFSAHYQPAKIRAPILVIHDDGDTFVTPDQAERIVASYEPRARLLRTQRLGHRRILNDQSVVDATVAFVNEAL